MRYVVVGKRMALGVSLLICCLIVGMVGGLAQVVRTAAAGQGEHPIYSVDTPEPLVSLGINCAWDNEDIPQLLEILEQQGVKATFFVVGSWCVDYPQSVRDIYQAGHEIGSHSDTHTDMTKLDEEGMRREIRESAQKIQAITGQQPQLFRPPSGSYNSTVVQVIRQEGMYPIQWNCDSVDYKNPTPQQMLERIRKTLGNGSILLFHSGARNTPEALPMIIQAIQDEGYTFVPVGELIFQEDYTVDFEGRQHRAGEKA